MVHSLLFAVSKRLLLLLADRSLQRVLPAIYRRLDAELPCWVQQPIAAATVNAVIAQTADAALQRDAKPHELELIKLLYDPAMAVVNSHFARANRLSRNS